MKKFWIGTAAVAVIGLVFCLFTEAENRYPRGPLGGVQVLYKVPVNGQEWANEFSFWIAGHVEKVQLVPTSGHNENGFVMLYIKTSQGWYETPTATLAGPVDWKRGVEVHFHYPEGMVLREQTSDDVHGFYPITRGIRWRRDSFWCGCHLLRGDIASVRFRQENGVDVTVQRTDGLSYHGHASGNGRESVEVTVFDK